MEIQLKIRTLFFLFFLLFLNINSQEKKEIQIDFLNTKYQKSGIIIPDNVEGISLPSYNYYNEKLGSFSVTFIPKTTYNEFFWSVNNEDGYFKNSKSLEERANDNFSIKKIIFNNLKDYYIIANYVEKRFIKSMGDEFEFANNSENKIYLYDGAKWNLLKIIKTKELPNNIIIFYKKEIIKNQIKGYKIPSEYFGIFEKNVETEMTTTGMASINYKFKISNLGIDVDKNSYHEPISCVGKYVGIKKNNVLNIYYMGNDEHCVSIEPVFKFKYYKNKYFMKGLGSLTTSSEWIELKKIR